jgi:thymidylate synthase
MISYLDIVNTILTKGEMKQNRTGVRTLAIAGAMFEHDGMNGAVP